MLQLCKDFIILCFNYFILLFQLLYGQVETTLTGLMKLSYSSTICSSLFVVSSSTFCLMIGPPKDVITALFSWQQKTRKPIKYFGVFISKMSTHHEAGNIPPSNILDIQSYKIKKQLDIISVCRDNIWSSKLQLTTKMQTSRIHKRRLVSLLAQKKEEPLF